MGGGIYGKDGAFIGDIGISPEMREAESGNGSNKCKMKKIEKSIKWEYTERRGEDRAFKQTQAE